MKLNIPIFRSEKISYLFLLAFVFFSSSCTKDTNTSSPVQQTEIARSIFSDSVTNFKVNVFYEIGAEPYVGNIGLTANSTWSITQNSYQALFQNHTARTITVPLILGGMTSVPVQNKSNWTSGELIALGQSLAPALSFANRINVTVVFVKGLYDGNSGILGIHFSNYPFAFVFKDVVTSVGGTSTDQRYVEQATTVHELGHVVGFTNNGVPLQTNYEDAVHPRHSTNSNCVMYWAVESSSSILSNLTGVIVGNSTNLFGSETLNDGRNYHP